MAHDVLVWKIDTSYTGSWVGTGGGSPYTLTADNFLHVQLEDGTGVLTVAYTSSSVEGAGTIYTSSLTEGPNLFFGYDGAATLLTVSPYYQFCDGTALRMIGTSNLFPYATLSFNEGAAECAIIPVCDLEIASVPVITDASGPITADGEVTVSATSSNGVIKYDLTDFDYATEGQLSPTFSGLLPGDYTVYAKDEAGCTDSIDISIPITEVYGVKYRYEFEDSTAMSGRLHRVDILERAYVGVMNEPDFLGGDPVHIRWNGDGNDPSKPIIPTEYIGQVIRMTVGQYADLFTQDDRLFKIQHYVDGTLYWSGFIAPELYSEPFIHEPFPLEFTAVDGLAELASKDFIDESGNVYKGEISAIVVIAEILKKCSLKLNIHQGINVFAKFDIDETIPIMDETDPTVDPLALSFIDMRIFEGLKCSDVLSRILEPFRAQIFQAEAVWWIVRLSDAAGSFAYRVFDYLGEYQSNSTINPTQNLDFPSITNRGCWTGLSQLLSHLRQYGYFSITHDPARDNNLIDEGRFEPEDIVTLGSGNATFKNWNFFIAQAGVQHGFEYVKNGESEGAALISYRSAGSSPQADNKLYSIQVPLSRFSGGYLRLQFQYLIRPYYKDLPYIRLGYSVKVFDADQAIWLSPDFPPDFSRANDTEELINEIYVTQFSSFQSVDITARGMFTNTPDGDQMYMLITFYSHNHYGRDFEDIADLKTFSISDHDVKTGRHVYVIDDSDNTRTNEYISEASTDAESLPDTVRPTDYAGDYLWRIGKSFTVPGTAATTSLVADVLIDNLSVGLFPQAVVNGQTVYIEPPEEVIYEYEVSTFIQSNLNKTVYLGDMPIFDDTNADIVHYNNENLIYRGWFRDADGNPTYRWKRKDVDEYEKLLQITLEDYRDQFSVPKRKLSGTFTSDILWSFLNAAQEQFEGSRYRFMTMDFNCKRAEYTVDLVQVVVGAGGEPPVETSAFDIEEFSEAYDI